MWGDGRRTNIVDTSGIRRRLAVGLGQPRSEQAMVGSTSPTIERIYWMRVVGDLEKAGGSGMEGKDGSRADISDLDTRDSRKCWGLHARVLLFFLLPNHVRCSCCEAQRKLIYVREPEDLKTSLSA